MPTAPSFPALPDSVRAEIERQVRELGVNYLLAYLFLGTMTLNEALRSLQLFSTEVMPSSRICDRRWARRAVRARASTRQHRRVARRRTELAQRQCVVWPAFAHPTIARCRRDPLCKIAAEQPQEVSAMANAKITGVRSIELGVLDLHRSAEFYSKVWALEEVSSEADAVHFRGTGAEHHVLTIRRTAEAGAARRALRRHRSGGGGRARGQSQRLRRRGRGRARAASRAAPAAATASGSAPPMDCP